MSKLKVERTFNYLSRYRILLSDIKIESQTTAQGQPIAMVRQIKLPPVEETAHGADRWRKADVLLEAWRGRSANWFRHSLGPVGSLPKKLKSPQTLALPEFEGADGVTYRIKVVSADTGQILAEAERIRPSNDDDKPGAVDELIPVRKEPSLGEQPWRLDWADDEIGPVVLVSTQLADCENFFTRDPAFVAAMMPQIMRDVLFRLALDGELREAAWAKKWFAFAARFNDREPPPTDSWREAQSWVDGLVQDFCDRNNFVTDANKFFNNDSAAV